MFNPRPGQDEVIAYQGGRMAVMAVPGSGKTHTLSCLAARLVASADLKEGQEVLIVTLVNSAVDNFSSRIAGFLRESGLLPGIGYRVRTLHGLANDIIREHPDLAGLDNHFSILDERASLDVLGSTVNHWMRTHPEFLASYSDDSREIPKKDNKWSELLGSFAQAFIKQCKDLQITPPDLRNLIDQNNCHSDLLECGYDIYKDYQQAINYRGAVDFEDLIRLAYRVLRNKPEYLEKLQWRWPYILEDEAQDSSKVQEDMLRLLTGLDGNWVRVGDSNQAIFETFTTADPELLRAFAREFNVVQYDLPHSGRSTASIIRLANTLIEWSQQDHPVPELRGTLSYPLILPTPMDDPQPNPPDEPDGVYIYAQSLAPDKELNLIVQSLKKWLALNPDGSVAVLVPRNIRGSELAEKCAENNLPFYEMLRSTKSTRDAAKVLAKILDFLADPVSNRKLVEAFTTWLDLQIESDPLLAESKPVCMALIRKTQRPEVVLHQSGIESEWEDSEQAVLLSRFFSLLARWQHAVILPIDQLIITLASEIFTEPHDLALAHKIAVILKSAAAMNPGWELPDFCDELDRIVNNQYQLYGFSKDDYGFNPDDHKGEVVISTIHKAKGLEWDRVYVISANNYDFPSLQPNDQYYSEKYFIRDQLNLEAEVLSRLKALASGDRIGLNKPEKEATLEARIGYCAERLRLLYVALTRARRQLIITYNTGRRNDCTEALPVQVLRHFWEEGLEPEE